MVFSQLIDNAQKLIEFMQKLESSCWEIDEEGIFPTHFTFSSVLHACASVSSLEVGMDIHTHIIKYGFLSNTMTAYIFQCEEFWCRSLSARDGFDFSTFLAAQCWQKWKIFPS